MSDTQHTADELRKEADATFTEEFHDDVVTGDTRIIEVFIYNERARSMLRAGADAMEKSDKFQMSWAGCEKAWDDAMDALVKAEARVKELESALWKIHNSAHCHALLKIEAAAALQVKP